MERGRRTGDDRGTTRHFLSAKLGGYKRENAEREGEREEDRGERKKEGKEKGKKKEGEGERQEKALVVERFFLESLSEAVLFHLLAGEGVELVVAEDVDLTVDANLIDL